MQRHLMATDWSISFLFADGGDDDEDEEEEEEKRHGEEEDEEEEEKEPLWSVPAEVNRRRVFSSALWAEI